MRYNNEPIHTIKLYGVMRQKFGKEIKLSGHSAAATIRGFALQNKEFGDALVQGFFRVLRGEKLKSAIPYAENEIGAEIGSQSQTFHLIPVPAGSKKGGLFGVIAGVFIMAAAIICAPWTGGASLAVGVASGGEFAVGAAAASLTAGGMSFGAAMGATAFMGISSCVYSREYVARKRHTHTLVSRLELYYITASLSSIGADFDNLPLDFFEMN